MSSPSDSISPTKRGDAGEVLFAFLRLGCLSFGGPVAHLGYFHTEFVERRHWCDEQTFAEIVALAQSAPGPASSQVGFSLGLLRAGWMGGLAAWVGFTAPSALLMLAFAFGHRFLTGRVGQGVVHGLQLVAVAVVAQAILAMRKALAPDVARMTVAGMAAAIVFFAPPSLGTIVAIAAGAVVGLVLPHSTAPAGRSLQFGISKRVGATAAALFLLLLVILPVAGALVGANATVPHAVQVFEAIYRTGALVFGGGHVVLPLLENAVVARGWVDQQSFLAGYGAAQALPGPLFTFAAYLGAVIEPATNPVLFSVLALVAIFLPGLLIIVAVLPFWKELRAREPVQKALLGVNAAVVGILMAAFVRPVWTSAVHSALDFAVAGVAAVLLLRWKVPAWIIVIGVAALSALVALL